MAKNIVILSDGTGNWGGKGKDSNIYKIALMAEESPARQFVFYDPGVGTDWRWMTGRVSGRGFSKNLCECYEQIIKTYATGDRLFLLGFSRGAATVRSLSSFIHYIGLLPPDKACLTKAAYSIYARDNEVTRKNEAAAFAKQHQTTPVKTSFLGCFDTVAALGLPTQTGSIFVNWLPFWKHRFHDFNLSKGVDNAFQALAIDENRKTFAPLLWNPQIAPGQTMRQVWFIGNHSDVGGGYPDHGLSDIALDWMLHHAARCGLLLKPNPAVLLYPDENAPIHSENDGLKDKVWRDQTRSWPSDRPDRPVIHPTVTQRTKNANNEEKSYHPWILDIPHDIEGET